MEAKTKETISKSTLEMVAEWGKRQGEALLSKMEKAGAKESLSLHWTMLKGSWLGGFTAGVQAGFQLGFESAKKLEAKSEDTADQLELPV